MWWRTSSTTRSRTARGCMSRSRNVPGELGADRVVADEVAVREGRRLADVVERAPPAGRPAGPPAPRRRPAACGPTGPRRRSCSAGSRAGRRGPARSAPAGPCHSATGARPTAPRRPAACRARSRCARPTGGATSSARAWIAGQCPGLDPEARASSPDARPGSSGARPPRTVPAARRRPAGRVRARRPARRTGRRTRAPRPAGPPRPWR